MPKLKNWFKVLVPSQLYWLPRYYCFLKHLDAKKYGMILDAGCGEGIVTERLSRESNTIGFDRSYDKIGGFASKKSRGLFVVGDLGFLPFKEQSFDLIFSLDAMEYIEKRNATFGEFHRLLKPGGRLFLTVTRDYVCSSRLYSAQRALRRWLPRFLYSHEMPGGKAWLELSSAEMAAKLGHAENYSFNVLLEEAKKDFSVISVESFIKFFTAMATDIVYGIKGMGFLKPVLFFISVRLDHHLLKNLNGYFAFVALGKK